MNKLFLILLLMLAPTLFRAQQAAVLDWTTFRAQVLAFHPVARQADLYGERAKAALLRARGGFDPKVYADISGKNFKDKNYFQYTEAGIKWPVGLGLEFKGAYLQATGAYLNPESSLPGAGQATAGINWSLGQGLLLDERRVNLRQSLIGLEENEAERQIIRNDLLLDAAKAYWAWVLSYNQTEVYEEALRQARIRHDALVESYRQGDKPAIDTLETFIQLQNRQIDANFAQTDRQNAALALCTFLWSDQDTPLSPEQLPAAPGLFTHVTAVVQDSVNLLQTALSGHPEIQLYRVKQRQLEVERRWKQEKRKPVLDLYYYFLGNGWQFFPSVREDGLGILTNDIKWGIQFSFPLPNRKARGDWQLTQIKIAQTDLLLQQKRVETGNKVRQYRNELDNLKAQIDLFNGITTNYRALFDAETERFRFGESSVFLLNTREQRWLDARIKLLKLWSEYRKTEAALLWAAGQLSR